MRGTEWDRIGNMQTDEDSFCRVLAGLHEEKETKKKKEYFMICNQIS